MTPMAADENFRRRRPLRLLRPLYSKPPPFSVAFSGMPTTEISRFAEVFVGVQALACVLVAFGWNEDKLKLEFQRGGDKC